MFQVNFTNRDGESCWADFSTMGIAIEYVDAQGGEILFFEGFDEEVFGFDPSDEYDGQPSEYDEWQDFYGGDDWDHGQYDEY